MAGPWEKYQQQQPSGPWLKYAEQPAPKEMSEEDAQLSKIRTASGGLIEGLPVVGPMIRSAGEHVAAVPLWLQSDDKSYGETLEGMRKETEGYRKEHPVLDKAAQITGGVAGTAPLVAMAPTLFGAGAGGLGSRSIMGGLSGMVLGGSDSAVRSGGDLKETGKGALIGLGTGAVAPVIGQAIGAGVRGVRDWWNAGKVAKDAGLDPSVLTRLGRAVKDDGLSPTAIRPRMDDLGPDAMLMDLGPNLQRQAGALAATPGRGQEMVRGAITARDAGANARIMGALDDTLGPAIPPSQVQAGIRAGQDALGPAYEEVLRNARRVDTTPVAEYLESAMVRLRGPAQRAARDIRQMLNVIGTDQLDPNPATLLQTRHAIDGLASANADTSVSRVLQTARQQVDDLLAASVPGIKDVDAQFAELARQREAFSRGQQVLDSGRTAPRPQELAQEVAEGALPQGRQIGPSAVPMRMRQGARDEIERIIGTNANDRVALQRLVKGEGDWNRQRLATLFGQERADKIINVLDRERLFADTSNIVTRNSETAARQAAMQEVAGKQGPQFGVREGYMSGGMFGGARSAAVRGAEKVSEALLNSRQTAGNERLAQALIASRYEPIIQALIKSQGGPINQPMIDNVTRALMLGGGMSAAR